MSSAAATRARAAPASLVRAVPVWAWVAGAVLVSALVRYAFARRIVAPWIFIDEIVYSELAKSFAESKEFRLRGAPAGGAFGPVYPILISPAYRLFEAVPDAYAAIKAINSLVISLTVIPVYLLARTVLRPAFALAAAVLALAVPSVLYAGTVMTENAFYPLFALVALLLVRALEQPTLGRSLALLAALGLAFATRAQALALVPAVATAPPLLVVLRGASWRGLAAYRTLYAALAAAAVLVAGAQLARGRALSDLLGAYSTVPHTYGVRDVAPWLLYHVAELDLYLGVAPFAAFVLLLAIARRLPAADQTFLAASLAVAVWVLGAVAAFASRYALRIEERNMFYLAPLFLIALLVWVERGAPRPRAQILGAAAVAATLPLLIPYERFIDVSAQSDTLALLVWWDVWEAVGGPIGRLALVVWLFSTAIAALVLLVPARYAAAVPAVVLAIFLVSLTSIENGDRGMRRTAIGALYQGMTVADRDWIDRAAGRDADVAIIWPGPDVPRLVVHQNEFFNRSVGDVYYLTEPIPDGLVQTPLGFHPADGTLRGPGGTLASAPYALVGDDVPLAGTTVARDRERRMRLMRVDEPFGYTHALEGVYPDQWTAPESRYVRYRCLGGTLSVVMDSDAGLFRTDQRIVARVNGRAVARTRIPRIGRATLDVPLRPNDDGHCVAEFSVRPSAVPGGDDTRRLGTHFRRFTYRP